MLQGVESLNLLSIGRIEEELKIKFETAMEEEILVCLAQVQEDEEDKVKEKECAP